MTGPGRAQGSATGLFGTWLKWLGLSIITLGIYLFWVGPRIARWKWENTDFDPTWQPATLTSFAPAPALSAPAGMATARDPA